MEHETKKSCFSKTCVLRRHMLLSPIRPLSIRRGLCLSFFMILLCQGPKLVASCPKTLRLTTPGTVLYDVGFKMRAEIGWDGEDPDANNYNYTLTVHTTTLSDDGAPEDDGVEVAKPWIGSLISEDGELLTELQIPKGFLKRYGTATLLATLSNERCRERPKVECTKEVYVIPAWLSLLPPVLVIVLGAITRQVLLSFFIAIWVGASLLQRYNVAYGLSDAIAVYLPNAMGNPDNASIILFSLMFSGMIAVISRAGGVGGLASLVIQWARDSRTGQLSTWGMGLLIFFDDYANCLIVGNTLRPITDRLRISREKLAFLVDSTAAPAASIAPVSTWVGFEVTLIGQQLVENGIPGSPYTIYLETIPMRYYPWLVLFMGLFIMVFMREAGPMLKAEQRARTTGKIVADNSAPAMLDDNVTFKSKEGVPERWYNALVPIFSITFVVVGGLMVNGYLNATQEEHISNPSVADWFEYADSYAAVMYGALAGLLVPVVMLRWQKIMGWSETLFVYVEGMKEVIEPVLILTHAWAIGSICFDLHLANWIAEGVEESLDVRLLSTVSFVVVALIALATGSAWSSLTIMFPIVVPIAWQISDHDLNVTYQNIACILAGSIVGDHVSPISDTTVLASLACKCEIADHVKTQAPYALIAAIVSILVGVLPTGFQLYTWIVALPAGILLIGLIVRLTFTRVDNYDPNEWLPRDSDILNKRWSFRRDRRFDDDGLGGGARRGRDTLGSSSLGFMPSPPPNEMAVTPGSIVRQNTGFGSGDPGVGEATRTRRGSGATGSLYPGIGYDYMGTPTRRFRVRLDEY